MSQRDIALTFLDRFCDGDVEGLATLLDERLRFRGPLLRADTRDAYLSALRDAPPEQAAYRVLAIAGNGDAVAIFYDYEKSAATVRVAQMFGFAGDRIAELLLVFDPTGTA